MYVSRVGGMSRGSGLMQRHLIGAAIVAATAVAAGGASPAAADLAQSAVVSQHPVRYTPNVLDGTVWTMTVIGRTVIVGGTFTSVADSSGRHRYARRNLFAFDLDDGTVLPFDPAVDGPVYALAAGPGDTVYVGGAFKTIDGARQRGLAQVDVAGRRIATFQASINEGDVRALAERSGRVYAGGTFSAVNGTTRVGLARLDASSGNLDTRFDARLSAPGLPRTRVEDFDISPDGRRLVAIGELLKSGGQDRTQIAMFDISGPTAALTGWYTDAYQPACAKDPGTYLRQVKFSPDGRYLVVVSTGGTSSPTLLCDAAARFQTGGTGRHDPVWVQRTGGNSLFAVAVTGSAVYVGGHERYLDNPYGTKKHVGPGAVSRPGIGALDPDTGRALAWNPTRSRGVGVHVFVALKQGLLVGSDTDQLAHEYHGRVGMFPAA